MWYPAVVCAYQDDVYVINIQMMCGVQPVCVLFYLIFTCAAKQMFVYPIQWMFVCNIIYNLYIYFILNFGCHSSYSSSSSNGEWAFNQLMPRPFLDLLMIDRAFLPVYYKIRFPVWTFLPVFYKMRFPV